MESKKTLIIVGVGATIGVIGYLYFKNKKSLVSETQSDSLPPELGGTTNSGSGNSSSSSTGNGSSSGTNNGSGSTTTLGTTFSNAQTIVNNPKVTTQQTSQVVSNLLNIVQQEKADALFLKLEPIRIKYTIGWVKHTQEEYAKDNQKYDDIIKELNNLGYELDGFVRFRTNGTLKKK
jgi:hypothetical protein